MMLPSTRQPLPSRRLMRPLPALGGLLSVLVVMLALAACGDDQQNTGPALYQFKVEVSVVDEDNNPVPKAPIVLDGKTVGYTDADGEFKAFLTDQEGKKIQIGVGEMPHYIVPDSASATETLKRTKSLKGDITTVPVSLAATVRSAEKPYLIWMEVQCGKYLDASKCRDLPILFKGVEVARTDDAGRAHFSFEGVPEDTVKVSIDTPKYVPSPEDRDNAAFIMKPADPTYDVKLGLGSQVLVIKELFDDPVAAVKAQQKPRRRHRARRRRPSRQSKAHHSSPHKVKKEAKKEEKKETKKRPDVIQLW